MVARVLILAVLAAAAAAQERLPNVVIVFTDDQGYADVGCYGAKGFETPNLDRLAAEGMRFTSFYVSQAVCGASRASLLTGCYANRVGLLGAPNFRARHGIHEREMTIAELLKQKGYATAIFGKWHLGHRKPFLPPHHGFDEYFGLPYSNDMWPFNPRRKDFHPPLPLIEGDEVVATNPDQSQLTTWYTERAVRFIEKNKERPFLVYVPHTMPHVPLFVSGKFWGRSEQGAYGDVIMEIDWSVGEIMKALDKHGLKERTLVIFTTDNGPWINYGNHAGSAGPLREGKGTAWEGGVRVPCIMRWPGRIPPGSVCNEMAATIDILPTLADLTGTKLPAHKIDGKSIRALMTGAESAKTPHEYYYFYYGRRLHAVRSGKWKLHFPHPYRSLTGTPGKDGSPHGYTQKKTGLALYDLESDLGETTDVKDAHPEVLRRLQALGEQAREDLGDVKRKGKGIRPAARIGND